MTAISQTSSVIDPLVLQSDVQGPEENVMTLIQNVREEAIIDLANGDLIMAVDDANTGVFLVINAKNDGSSVLLNPFLADDTSPKRQIFITGFAGASFYYGSETGGSPTNIISPYNDIVTYIPNASPTSMFNSFIDQSAYSNEWVDGVQAPTTGALATILPSFITRGITNTQSGTTYTLAATDAFGWCQFTNAAPVTVTIPKNATIDMGSAVKVDILSLGAGGITVVGEDGTVVISGDTAIILNGKKTLKRDAHTDNWSIG